MFSVKTGMMGTPAAMATVAKPCLGISWYCNWGRASSPRSPEYLVVWVRKVSLTCPSWSYPQQWPIPERLKIGAKGIPKLRQGLTLAAQYSSLWCLGKGWSALSLDPGQESPSDSCTDMSIGRKYWRRRRWEMWETYRQHWRWLALSQAKPPRLWHNSRPAQPENIIKLLFFGIKLHKRQKMFSSDFDQLWSLPIQY